MISIIVPVYNVEKYLQDCLESILSQTYVDWEAVLVDDGSLDMSGKICDEYALRDSRFKVIHQRNMGLSGARNTGLKKVIGEYIGFIDSDDIIHPMWLKILYEIAVKKTCDIAICNYRAFSNHIPTINAVTEYYFTEISANEVIRNFYNYQMSSNVWTKLYSRKIIGDTRFTTCKAEDWDFNLQLLIKKNIKIAYTDIPLYFYRIRNDSLTGGYDEKWLLDDLISQCDIYEHYLTADKYACYRHVILHRLYRNTLNFKVKIKDNKEYLKYGDVIFKEVFKRTYDDFKNCKALPAIERKTFSFFYRYPSIYKYLFKLKRL